MAKHVITTDEVNHIVQHAIWSANNAPAGSVQDLDSKVVELINVGLQRAMGGKANDYVVTLEKEPDGENAVKHLYHITSIAEPLDQPLGTYAENFRWREGILADKYIGTKIISAYPVPRDGLAGYAVIYRDDFQSWSPKAEFEDAYRRADGLNFGLALEALKRGLRVARKGWNGKGMWVALGGTPVTLEADKFWNPHSRAHAVAMGGSAVVDPYIIMKTAQDSIQMGWVPSQADILADDWCIIANEVAFEG